MERVKRERRKMQEEKIKEYNENAKRENLENKKAVDISSTLEKIKEKAKDKEDKEIKKNNEMFWRRYEKEKEDSLYTNSGKLKFSDIEEKDLKVEDEEENKPKAVIKYGDGKDYNYQKIKKKYEEYAYKDLDTLDDDSEISLLRKRRQYNELKDYK